MGLLNTDILMKQGETDTYMYLDAYHLSIAFAKVKQQLRRASSRTICYAWREVYIGLGTSELPLTGLALALALSLSALLESN